MTHNTTINWISATIYKAFFIIYAIGMFQYAYNIWQPDAEIYIFYKLLITFDAKYNLFYLFNKWAAFINLLTLIPFGYHAFNKKTSLTSLWKILFIARIVADSVGHFYEWQFLKSAIYFGGFTTVATISAFFALHIPSYWAHYELSFSNKFKKTN